jgi:hypothetical protein
METGVKGSKYWLGVLLYGYLFLFLGTVACLAIIVYVAAPIYLWLFHGITFHLPSDSDLVKAVRFSIWASLSGGSILWLSKFLPWMYSRWFPTSKNNAIPERISPNGEMQGLQKVEEDKSEIIGDQWKLPPKKQL